MHTALQDSIINKNTLTSISELEGIYNIEKKNQEIKSLKQKEYLRNTIIYSGLIIITLLIILLWYYFYKRKKTLQQQIELKEQNIKIIGLKLENEEAKNQHYTNELNQFMQLIMTKNKQLKELQKQVENSTSSITTQNDKAQKLNQLYNTTILTEKDWKHFRSIFDQLYPDFISNLNNHTTLSNSDNKTATLIKLNLSNSEISSILGISPESVRKSKYRLRQKLNLSNNKELHSFLVKL